MGSGISLDDRYIHEFVIIQHFKILYLLNNRE